jgi:hypothetical protein
MDPHSLAIKLNQARQDLEFLLKKFLEANNPDRMDHWEKLILLKIKDIKRLKAKRNET